MVVKKRAAQFIRSYFPTPAVKRILHANETRLLQGHEIGSANRKSVLFYTTKRCGSTFMRRCMKYLNAQHMKLRRADFEVYRWKLLSQQESVDFFEQNRSVIFRPAGVMYGPLREYVAVPDTQKYRVLLMLRDPRDVLVSDYFSRAFSHGLPGNSKRREEYLSDRSRTQDQTVDDYVHEYADYYHGIYQQYYDNLVVRHNVPIVRYRDFVLDYERWISDVEAALEIRLTDRQRRTIFEMKGGNAPIKEDKHNHRRKVIPGDHREKLSVSSQNFLSEKFADVIDALALEDSVA